MIIIIKIRTLFFNLIQCAIEFYLMVISYIFIFILFLKNVINVNNVCICIRDQLVCCKASLTEDTSGKLIPVARQWLS